MCSSFSIKVKINDSLGQGTQVRLVQTTYIPFMHNKVNFFEYIYTLSSAYVLTFSGCQWCSQYLLLLTCWMTIITILRQLEISSGVSCFWWLKVVVGFMVSFYYWIVWTVVGLWGVVMCNGVLQFHDVYLQICIFYFMEDL